jgi:hypothetical protein
VNPETFSFAKKREWEWTDRDCLEDQEVFGLLENFFESSPHTNPRVRVFAVD